MESSWWQRLCTSELLFRDIRWNVISKAFYSAFRYTRWRDQDEIYSNDSFFNWIKLLNFEYVDKYLVIYKHT